MTAPTPDLPDWTRTSAVIDNPRIIASTSGQVPLPHDLGVIDVSRYRSVRIYTALTGGAAGAYAGMQVVWEDLLGAATNDQWYVWDNNAINPVVLEPAFYLPVRGNNIDVSFNQAAGGSMIDAVVYGSLIDQYQPEVYHGVQSIPPLLGYANVPALAAGASYTFSVGETVGDVDVAIATGAEPMVATVYYNVTGPTGNASVEAASIPAAANSVVMQRVAAAHAILGVVVRNNGTATGSMTATVMAAH